MKSLITIFALLVTITAHAESTCLPATAEAKDWPVQTIYLHGLLPVRGFSGAYAQMERDNRQKLTAFAEQHHIRIAVPVSTEIGTYQHQPYRVWDRYSLTSIEAAAQAACGGAPLAPHRVLIGFSRGAIEADDIAHLSCDKLKNYDKFVLVGTPRAHTHPNHCGPSGGDLTNYQQHDFAAASAHFNSWFGDILSPPVQMEPPAEYEQ